MKIEIDTDKKEVIILKKLSSDNINKFLRDHNLNDYKIVEISNFEDLTKKSYLSEELDKYKNIKVDYGKYK